MHLLGAFSAADLCEDWEGFWKENLKGECLGKEPEIE